MPNLRDIQTHTRQGRYHVKLERHSSARTIKDVKPVSHPNARTIIYTAKIARHSNARTLIHAKPARSTSAHIIVFAKLARRSNIHTIIIYARLVGHPNAHTTIYITRARHSDARTTFERTHNNTCQTCEPLVQLYLLAGYSCNCKKSPG